MTAALSGLRVLDFTTLLPGPLATLMLADAGATVVKVERRDGGDPGRANQPAREGISVQFALLNRGKKSIAADLKDAADHAAVLKLAQEADILVEQFRPGVMDRLGLGWETLRKTNPRLIYCSITGFGQTGPLAQTAGHDLTYLARAGMLALVDDGTGKPSLPCGQIADVGGGSLPALVSILMALLRRSVTGEGCHLDVAMTENVLAWMPRSLAPVLVGQPPPVPGRGRHTGGSPRYGLYAVADGIVFAVAPLENKFWNRFCELIELDPALRDDAVDPDATRRGVAASLAKRSAAEWEQRFAGEDVCVERVCGIQDLLSDAHFAARGVFGRWVMLPDGERIPALPVPIARNLLDHHAAEAPQLGASIPDAGIWESAQR